MISISEDRNTAGIVKVTLFADTFKEMMDAYSAFPNYPSHYNANIEKHTLRLDQTTMVASNGSYMLPIGQHVNEDED